jgi:hypothetical protein
MQEVALDKPSDHYSESVEEIWKGIDFEHNEGLLLDSSVGSASTRNWGGFTTLDYRSPSMIHLIASYNH